MKNILFIGDSLTWNSNPDTGIRHNIENRWTTMLENFFPEISFTFIGVPGVASGVKPWLNSDLYTLTNMPSQVVYSQLPLDKIFLFIGTNDYLASYEKHADASSIVTSISNTINKIVETIEEVSHKYNQLGQKLVTPKIVVVTPPRISKTNGRFEIDDLISKIYEKFNNYFTVVNLQNLLINSKDGVHMSVEDNKKFFEIIKKYINE